MKSNKSDALNCTLAGTSSRRQALKLMGGGLLGGAAMAVGLKGAAAKPDRGPNLLADIPVTGTEDVSGNPFEVFVTITQLYDDGAGGLLADGQMTGTYGDVPFTNAALGLSRGPFAVSSRSNQLASASHGGDVVVGARTQQGGGSCQILYLDLGPLFLDVLGLEVSLDPVVLDITAQRGPGNLLGNLLCAVAGLLDGGNTGGLQGLLQQINNILNQLLGGL